MWFVPGSHKMPLRPHRPTKEGEHVLMTDDVANVRYIVQSILNYLATTLAQTLAVSTM